MAFLVAGILALTVATASAEAETDRPIKPVQIPLGQGWTLRLGASANVTTYTANQTGLSDRQGLTASLFLNPRIEKLFANGWRLGLRSSLNAYHDTLSGDYEGNDFVKKLYFFLDAPWGRVELGQQEGAGEAMAITGPLVEEAVALDDPSVSFFRNPATGQALIHRFDVRSFVYVASNEARISYYSPRLFGVQVGISYTPHLVKQVLPFIANPPDIADRQNNIVEGAINYTGYFGNTSVGAYAGIAGGHISSPSPGHDDLFDWGLGAELDYDFGGTVLAVGGSWHQSNGYGFEPDDVFANRTSRALHASSTLTHGDWKFGVEYLRGSSDAADTMPALDMHGYAINAGYEINANLELTAGWQHRRMTQSSGAFYNGHGVIDMDAGYLLLHVHI